MSNELLKKLLGTHFSHFKQVGDDDWRDPNESNPSLSLSSRGYFDHRTYVCGSLLKLAKAYHLSGLQNFKEIPPRTLAQKIWEVSQLARDSKTEAYKLVSAYLTKSRKIPLDAYRDLLNIGMIRVNQYKDEKMIVYPSLSVIDAQHAFNKCYYEVKRIQRIFINEDGSKKYKKHLGTQNGEAVGFVIPPLENTNEKSAIVVEGIEDALSIRLSNPGAWYFVATDKNGLRTIEQYFHKDKFLSVLIIADHDIEENPAVTGQAFSWRLGQRLKASGIEKVQVLMPAVPKNDANLALQEGRFSDWKNSLIEVPELFQISETGTNKTEVISEENSLRIIKASDVEIRPIKWLWSGVMALGKLIILSGEPGLGKSQVSLFVASVVSKGGYWPVTNEKIKSGNVLILSAEDGAQDTIIPRLEALGANLDNIHIICAVPIENGKERSFDLTLDVEKLQKSSERISNVKLIIVDPISAYLGKTDSHRNSDVRSALTPVSDFAEASGACLLCVTHLNKGGQGTSAMNRVTGSIAFVAASRASYVVTKDPNDPDMRLMLPLKNNLAKDINGFAYRIEEKEIHKNNELIKTSFVTWEPNFITLTAEEVLSGQSRSSNRKIAEDILIQELGGGGAILCKQLYQKAEDQDISKKVLWSAAKRLNVKEDKGGFNNGWLWQLALELSPVDS